MECALTINQLKLMNIGKKYWGASRIKLTRNQSDSIAPYLNDISKYTQDGIGVFLWGSNGVGKTFIAAMLCKYVRAEFGLQSLCITASELKEVMIKDRPLYPNCLDTYGDLIHSVDFLVLDGLGKEYRTGSGYVESMCGALLEERSKACKITSVTSSLAPNDYKAMYGPTVAYATMDCTVCCKVTDINHKLARSTGWQETM